MAEMPEMENATVRRGLRLTGLAVLSTFLVPACGGGESTSGISADAVCGGLSDDAARSLEQLTSQARFEESSSTADKEQVAGSLIGNTKSHQLCVITPETDKESRAATVSFRRETELPAESPDRDTKTQQYPEIGLRAESQERGADIFFECRGKIIRGTMTYYRPGNSETDQLDDRIFVLRELSYNIAKGMGCYDSILIPKV